jgi:hypothetical protein
VDRHDNDVGDPHAVSEKRENGNELAIVVMRLVVADNSWKRLKEGGPLELGSDRHLFVVMQNSFAAPLDAVLWQFRGIKIE